MVVAFLLPLSPGLSPEVRGPVDPNVAGGAPSAGSQSAEKKKELSIKTGKILRCSGRPVALLHPSVREEDHAVVAAAAAVVAPLLICSHNKGQCHVKRAVHRQGKQEATERRGERRW